MSQFVVLNFGHGNCKQGFPTVVAQLWVSGNSSPIKLTGSLPSAWDLSDLYQRWRSLYDALYDRFGGLRGVIQAAIEFEEEEITQVSRVEFNELSQKLKQYLNRWLDSGTFGRIERQLRTRLNPAEEIRVIIETEDSKLRRLPWHLWNFFEDYPKAEVALSTPEYGRVETNHSNHTGCVRILAILGNSDGINIAQDRALLEHLPGAKTVFLVEPQRWELNQQLWDEQGWDILFFAGHSSSHRNDITGQININQQEAITITELKYALQAAIARGLKLAVFNSCDGLGLARELTGLQIPQLIIMREPVPDRVAQEFLKHWLTAFSQGQSFYQAVREARQKLQGLEKDFPCACWLPVICQNPAVASPTWEQLRGIDRLRSRRAMIASAITTVAVIAIRSLGLLQGLELSAYDTLMRLRPLNEGMDSRILLVEATESDIQKLGGEFPLPDQTLVNVINKLNSYQPRVLGIDIYRDQRREPGSAELVRQFSQNPNLIAVCSVSQVNDPNKPGVKPPEALAQNYNQLGFTDVVVDVDDVLRRQLLFMNPEGVSPCQTEFSLSFQLARHYLAEEGIKPQLTLEEQVQLGSTVLKPLEKNAAGYHQLDYQGFQILLNYRASPEVARRVTFSEVLNDKIDPQWVEDRLVLIGVSAPISTDHFSTPYSQGQGRHQRMPGVIIQAQMVSQILSAVLDDRPLIWEWSYWLDWVWIGSWSIVGGIIAWRCQKLSDWGITITVAVVSLSGVCFIFLIGGGWVPLIPSGLTLVVTASSPFLIKKS